MTAGAGESLRYLTPPEIAARMRVKVATVRGWIVSGELVAMNLSAGRPKYRVRPKDLETFERTKLVCKPEKTVRRTTRKPANYL